MDAWSPREPIPKLLGHRAVLDAQGRAARGQPRLDDPSVTADIENIVGGGGTAGPRQVAPRRFDILPLLVATDGGIAAFGYNGRRLRPDGRDRRSAGPGRADVGGQEPSHRRCADRAGGSARSDA